MSSRGSKDKQKKAKWGPGGLAGRSGGPAVRQGKASEALHRFVEPYLEDDDSMDAVRNVFMMGAVGWNLGIVPDDLRPQMLDDSLDGAFPPDDHEARAAMRSLVLRMVARKLAYFAEDRRFVTSVDVEPIPGGYNVTVTWSPAND